MASQKELLSTKGQDKMEKLKGAQWDDMGGPELDWSIDQYMKSASFKTALGISPDSTILGKAAVKAEKGETVKEAVEHEDEEDVKDSDEESDDKPKAKKRSKKDDEDADEDKSDEKESEDDEKSVEADEDLPMADDVVDDVPMDDMPSLDDEEPKSRRKSDDEDVTAEAVDDEEDEFNFSLDELMDGKLDYKQLGDDDDDLDENIDDADDDSSMWSDDDDAADEDPTSWMKDEDSPNADDDMPFDDDDDMRMSKSDSMNEIVTGDYGGYHSLPYKKAKPNETPEERKEREEWNRMKREIELMKQGQQMGKPDSMNEEMPDDLAGDATGDELYSKHRREYDRMKQGRHTPDDGEGLTEKKHDEEDGEDESLEESRLVLSFKFDQADKLFESNNTLTEEDKQQGRRLFEAAIRDVAKQVGVKLNEAYAKKFTRAKALHEKKLAKQVNAYLDYVVEEWAKQNKVAIKSQIQVRLTESFLKNMKSVFAQHYVEVPESRVNVVEALAKNVKSLKKQVRESNARVVAMHSKMKKAVIQEKKLAIQEHRKRLIAEAANTLPAVDRGRFAKHADSLAFTNTKTYKKDLVALREQYFGAKTSKSERSMNLPDADPAFERKKESTAVDKYTAALDKFSR